MCDRVVALLVLVMKADEGCVACSALDIGTVKAVKVVRGAFGCMGRRVHTVNDLAK